MKKILFKGKTIQLLVFINTDEDVKEVASRVHLAARGPKERMTIVMNKPMTNEEGTRFWNKMIRGQSS